MSSSKPITASQAKYTLHRIIYRLSLRGMCQASIAEVVGYSQSGVCMVLSRIQDSGGWKNYKVGKPPGRKGMLNDEQFDDLKVRLRRGAKANGFPTPGWTRRRVRSLISACYDYQYSLSHISRIMKKLGYSLQKPQNRDPRRQQSQIEYYEKKVLPELKKKSLALGKQ